MLAEYGIARCCDAGGLAAAALWAALTTTALPVSAQPSDAPLSALVRQERCPLSAAVPTDGMRRLALVVGVGRFRDPALQDKNLKGPVGDAEQIHRLLTDAQGYGFSKENVCLLTDEDATLVNVREAFRRILTDRAQPGDLAVFYFAGHGSQVPDEPDGDETDDGLDETLVLHDADSAGNGQLVDDELQDLLLALRARTDRITLIFDSCHSGTAARGPGSTGLRSLDMRGGVAPAAGIGGEGDRSFGLSGDLGPGVVILSAAADGTPAFEQDGAGVFTRAFVKVTSQVGPMPPTYRQIMRAVQQATASYGQFPTYKGDVNRLAFENAQRSQPRAWEIVEAGPSVSIRGAPMPGWGMEARLRAYEGNAAAADFADPGKAKASLVIERMTTPYEATAVLVGEPVRPLQGGDLVTLVTPAPEAMRTSVRIRPEDERVALPGVASLTGVPADRAAHLRSALQTKAETDGGIELAMGAATYEFAVDADGALALLGPEGQIRARFEPGDRETEDAAWAMWLHSLQQRILNLSGEAGADFTNNKTLAIELVPSGVADLPNCVTHPLPPREGDAPQSLPNGLCWKVRITVASDTRYRLRIGGLLLTSSGAVFALGNSIPTLAAGEAYTFPAVFRAAPPLNIADHILVIGTQESVGLIPWYQLDHDLQEPGRESGSMVRGAGYDDLLDWLGLRSRGAKRVGVSSRSWTTSHMPILVKANP